MGAAIASGEFLEPPTRPYGRNRPDGGGGGMKRPFKGLRQAAAPGGVLRRRRSSVPASAAWCAPTCSPAKAGLEVLLIEQHYMAGRLLQHLPPQVATPSTRRPTSTPCWAIPDTLTGKAPGGDLGDHHPLGEAMDPVDTFHFPDGSSLLGCRRTSTTYLGPPRPPQFPHQKPKPWRASSKRCGRAYFSRGILHYFRGRRTLPPGAGGADWTLRTRPWSISSTTPS